MALSEYDIHFKRKYCGKLKINSKGRKKSYKYVIHGIGRWGKGMLNQFSFANILECPFNFRAVNFITQLFQSGISLIQSEICKK